MSKSIFEENLKKKFKDQKNNELSQEDKQNFRLKALEDIFLQIGDRQNRYLFYCPDIMVVNDLVQVIYDLALTVQDMGFKTTVLHEINGFKCKWLYELDDKYKNLNVEYIIHNKNKKSKKTKQQYAFRPSDTLIVPDVFQEIFDNIYEVKLIQKVLLVSGYTGIGALASGINYSQLGVQSFLFLEKKLKDDYEKLFNELPNSFVLDYKIDKKVFDPAKVNLKEIYPIICISNLGNVKFSQQVINIFYNLYPHLNVFSFKLVNRNNYEEYISSLKHCCLYLNLDEQIGFKKNLLEALNLGVNLATFVRRELSEDTKLGEYIQMFDKDPFTVAEFLGQYCSFWINNSTSKITNEVDNLKKQVKIENYTEESFINSTKKAFSGLQDARIKFFASIQKSINEETK